MAIRIGTAILGRKRPGFDQEFGSRIVERVREFLASTDYDVYDPPERITDDASLRQALEDHRAHNVDVLIVIQPTMGDGRLAPTAGQLWDKPIVLWATPEKQEGEMISSCSLVGAHNWASIFRRMDHPFELVYGDPAHPETAADFDQAVRSCHTAVRLGSARVGLIGSHAPGFFAMATGPFSAGRALGVQFQSYDLQDLSSHVHARDDEAVASDVEATERLGLPFKEVTPDALPMASRLYLAMRRYYEEEDVDALAVRCWPEMPNMFDQWPYLAMTRLASEDYPIAVEGDVDGAVCALIGKHLGMGVCHSSDWLEHDADTITLWHGGNLPFAMSPPVGEPGGPVIANHFNVRKPAVIESTLRPGMQVTLLRLWELDGSYRMAAIEAEMIEPKRHLMGSNGLAKVEGIDVRDLFRELVYAGMPHHVSVFEGHHKRLLGRFARLSGIEPTAW